MKITLLVIGKTLSDYLKTGENDYLKRLTFYGNMDHCVIPALKNAKSLTEEQQKTEEGKLLLSKIEPSDFCVLLDENGKNCTSEEFADFLNGKMVSGVKNLVFVVGGAYGFSDPVYQRANHKLSLSSMTFSHQMVRLIFLEQLYRAFTILKGEPYHHR
ncbi:MAG: 23S rRNA (pseudouridine(1915)-N(3))-methyltransferase RlmH [Bacteroidales bacterium]|nr:23S rRNA (pseudouridine(1915)-N(3))-methyltransferase RlmH [Bacteroidales bacterium]